MTIEHSAITAANNHGIVSALGPYANQTARRAAVLTSDMVGKVALQTSDSTLWVVLPSIVTPGTYVWGPLSTGPEATFSGDFAGIFSAGAGLTVDASWYGWAGLHSTGSVVNTWDNQVGTYGSIAEGSAGIGIGSTTTVGGRVAVVANGTTQYGTVLDNPVRPAPGTTNVHYYTIYRSLPTTPGGQAHLWGQSGFVQPLFQNASDQLSVYAASSLASTGATSNTWARCRASLTGATSGTADKIKWGSAAEVGGFAGNNAGGAGNSHGLFATESGTNKGAFALALHIIVRGPIASFLTQAALADAQIDNWFGAGVIQH